MITGSAVEVGDEFAGGGEHDRVKPGGPVGNPRGERILGCLGEIADMHAAMIKVERRVRAGRLRGGRGRLRLRLGR